jgi:DNA polymerase-3 subunit delta
MDSQLFLDKITQAEPKPVYVLHGDEDFLKRQVVRALRRLVLGTEDDTMGLSAHAGDRAVFAAVHDELRTAPFLSAGRLVIIDNADPFVTKYRANLEKYVAEPATTGSLVLDVKTWPSNTRLAKLIDSSATLVCGAIKAPRLHDWCVKWAEKQHGKRMAASAAQMLVELVGADMGQLDQDIAKLAVYVGSAAQISDDDVDKLVGFSREENTWKIFDAIGAGQIAQALMLLDHLFDQGEDPHRMMGAFSSQLRRLAQAARLAQQGTPLPAALARSGVPPFAVKNAEQQLRHLGRRRIDQLYDWLLETDQGLKGYSSLPPRTVMERLVVRLARSA